MKLQKIKDVRVGQIWTFNKGRTYDIVLSVRSIDDNFHHEVSEVVFEIWADFDYATGKKDKEDINNRYLVDIEYTKKGEKVSQDLLEKFKQPDKYLVGFLGITHKIEDGRLVEIERKEFEIDDIVEYNDKKYIITYANRNSTEDYSIYYINEVDNLENKTVASSTDFKKLGILGVNYEFINNKMKEHARNNNKNRSLQTA